MAKKPQPQPPAGSGEPPTADGPAGSAPDGPAGGSAPDPDLLAAVVLDTLVSRGTGGMTLAQVAAACERDPADAAETREVEVALGILLADGLASRRGALWQPTRAAIRAAELSF